MGEFSASDNSWKKMVITKSENQWSSNIKTEDCDDDTGNSTCFSHGFSLEEPGLFETIKRESEDANNQIYRNSEETPENIVQELDPLVVDVGDRRPRRSSGGKSETPEERAARLAKMSAYAAQRLANETPEQRATRLKRMSQYAAKRLAQESSEQRAKRLKRMSEYAAARLAKETPEQRQARLTRMSAYAAKRQAMKKAINWAASADDAPKRPDTNKNQDPLG